MGIKAGHLRYNGAKVPYDVPDLAAEYRYVDYLLGLLTVSNFMISRLSYYVHKFLTSRRALDCEARKRERPIRAKSRVKVRSRNIQMRKGIS